MVASYGEIVFIFFYAGFLGILLFWISTIPVELLINEEILTGISEETLEILNTPVEFEFDILNPFGLIQPLINVVAKFGILLGVSSSFQFLAIFLGILSIVMAFILLKTITDIIPG